MRLSPAPIASLLVATALAGCLAQDTNVVDSPLDDIVDTLEGYVDPFVMGHDHADVGLHKLAFRMTKLDHHPLGGDALEPSGTHALAIRGDWLFAAAWGTEAGKDGGVYVFSLYDPQHPRLVGTFLIPGALGGDRSISASSDGNWVVLGTELRTSGNQVSPFGPGLYLLDARDKANLKLSDYVADRRGVHTVSVHNVGGAEYSVSLGGGGPLNKNIKRIDATTGKFVDVGLVYVAHDTAVYDDELLGKPLLYVANVSALIVYDFSNPAVPVELGRWYPQDQINHYVHSITYETIGGRRILALESEDWKDKPSPLWLLDATDLSQMELLSEWTNPAGAPASAKITGDGVTTKSSLAFSTHTLRLEGGIVYLAHYHAGVWLLDVRTPEKQLAPEILGYFLPDEDNGGYKPRSGQGVLPWPGCGDQCYGGFQDNQVPTVYDVEVWNGIVYVADAHTGLYTVTYDASASATSNAH